jgi:hypothetical protein
MTLVDGLLAGILFVLILILLGGAIAATAQSESSDKLVSEVISIRQELESIDSSLKDIGHDVQLIESQLTEHDEVEDLPEV